MKFLFPGLAQCFENPLECKTTCEYVSQQGSKHVAVTRNERQDALLVFARQGLVAHRSHAYRCVGGADYVSVWAGRETEPAFVVSRICNTSKP